MQQTARFYRIITKMISVTVVVSIRLETDDNILAYLLDDWNSKMTFEDEEKETRDG